MPIEHSQNSNGLVVMEAEDGDLTPGELFTWVRSTPGGNVSGEIIQPTGSTWNKPQEGIADYQFTLTTGGTFTFFVRCTANGADGKARFEFDGNPNSIGIRFESVLYYTFSGDYRWSNSNDNATITLGAGAHTLRIYSIRQELKIDRMALVPSGNSDITEGSTAIGPASTSGAGATVDADSYTFEDWLRDPTRRAKRALLIEINRAVGAPIRLGSLPVFSDQNTSFDDWLTGSPRIDSSISSAPILANIDAVNFEPESEPWQPDLVRGELVRARYGDVDWPLSDYRLLASNTVAGLLPLGSNRYRFEIGATRNRLNTTFHTGDDTTVNTTILEGINAVLGELQQYSQARFINIPSADLNISVRYQLNESTRARDLLDKLALTARAYIRETPDGNLEFLRPEDVATVTLTEHDIVESSVRVARYTPAVSSVMVNYDLDTQARSFTASSTTGTYTESAEYSTLHVNADDVDVFGAAYAGIRASVRNTWEMGVSVYDKFLQVGDRVNIEHPDLTATGVVTDIALTPLEGASRIEVET